MAALGATAETVAEAAARAPRAVAVAPANHAAVTLFLACATQWRRAGCTGLPTGLDYAGVRAAAAALRLRWDADTLRRLSVIEAAALAAFAERAERERANG